MVHLDAGWVHGTLMLGSDLGAFHTHKGSFKTIDFQKNIARRNIFPEVGIRSASRLGSLFYVVVCGAAGILFNDFWYNIPNRLRKNAKFSENRLHVLVSSSKIMGAGNKSPRK